MKTSGPAVVAALAAAMAFFVAAGAMAQFGGMGGGRRGMRMDRGSSGGPKQPAAQENIANLIDYRLALLQEDLNLTRDQESGWVTYEERVKALAGDLTRERQRAQSAALTSAVEQVKQAANSARNRLAAWEDIAAATQSLYDSLTPQQKTLADQRFPSIVHELAGVPVPGDPGPKSFASPGPAMK